MKKENLILFLKIFVLFTIISTSIYSILDLIISGKINGVDLGNDLVFCILGSLIITNRYKTKEGRSTEKEAIELIEKHKLLKEEDENNIISNFTGIQKFFTKNITYNKNTKMISGPALYIENSIE